MDCVAICFLVTAVQFIPKSSTVNSSYCVETRSTYEHCFKDVIECAYRDPSSLILCLNINEKNRENPSFVSHTIRCVSYKDHYVEDELIREISSGGSCAFDHYQQCNCDNNLQNHDVITTTQASTEKATSYRGIHRHHQHKNESAHIRKKNHPDLFKSSSSTQQFEKSEYQISFSNSFCIYLTLLVCFFSNFMSLF